MRHLATLGLAAVLGLLLTTDDANACHKRKCNGGCAPAPTACAAPCPPPAPVYIPAPVCEPAPVKTCGTCGGKRHGLLGGMRCKHKAKKAACAPAPCPPAPCAPVSYAYAAPAPYSYAPSPQGYAPSPQGCWPRPPRGCPNTDTDPTRVMPYCSGVDPRGRPVRRDGRAGLRSDAPRGGRLARGGGLGTPTAGR